MENRQQLSILVIEDNEMFRCLALEMLSGHILSSAKDAAGGIDSFKTQKPDIVFLDIGLPDNDGHYVLSEIMKINPQAFVIMLTSSNLKEDVQNSLKEGAKGYIIKPFSRKQIKESIEEYNINKKK